MPKIRTAFLPQELRDILNHLYANYSEAEIAKVIDAFEFARVRHGQQVRKSGEPYIIHPLNVARILAEMNLDIVSIEAGLLHDVAEDTTTSLDEIEAQFGKEVSRIVDGVTKIDRLNLSAANSDEKAETVLKMFFAMAEDIRVILVKLADRLHNLRTLDSLTQEKQVEKAKETLQIYAPIAHRLGIHTMKWQLEDLAFKYLHPEEYRLIAETVDRKRSDRELIKEEYKSLLQLSLARQGISSDISGREKHFYSIFLKMREKGKGFDEIYDLIALRVITESDKDCYFVLGIVHNLWKPIPGRVKDYIAIPKSNGYRSLHTTVITHRGEPLEIQIRSQGMHKEAEYGLAAHWIYKEGKITRIHHKWITQLEEWQKDYQQGVTGLGDFQKELQLDEVYIFTPKGELRHVPRGATTIDFAYSVHTEVGHHYAGAKANGRIVPINYELQNGDRVEIIVNKNSPGPSLDWLKYARSSSTRAKIRKFFKEKYSTELMEKGKDLLRQAARKLQISMDDLIKDARLLKLLSKDSELTEKDVLLRLGEETISVEEIASVFRPGEKTVEAPADSDHPMSPSSTVLVDGASGIDVKTAKCCTPVPGDKIIGIVSQKGITIHMFDCPNVQSITQGQIVTAEWGDTSKEIYPVQVLVEAEDSASHVVKDIIQKAHEKSVKVAEMNTRFTDWSVTVYRVIAYIKNEKYLSELMDSWRKIGGVNRVYRVREGS